jgi:nucleoside-diphosphate-sugar epimerase
MKILITGGNGFLGSNTARKLLQHGHEVYIISKNTNNITDILPQIKFNSEYTQDIQDFSPDVAIHFGWKGGNNSQDVNDLLQFYDNMPMSIDLLQILNGCSNKPKFIGIGSFAEYGEFDFPIKESDIERPYNLYGVSKLSLKSYSEVFCLQNQMEWSWVRPCYTYGPGDVETRLIPTIVNKCLKNEDIYLDSCNKTIDYIYIDDFCNYMLHLITNPSSGVYNLCSGKQYNLKDIIEKIHNIVGNSNKISYNQDITYNPKSKWVCGDNIKILNESKQSPLVSIELGLANTINYYKTI